MRHDRGPSCYILSIYAEKRFFLHQYSYSEEKIYSREGVRLLVISWENPMQGEIPKCWFTFTMDTLVFHMFKPVGAHMNSQLSTYFILSLEISLFIGLHTRYVDTGATLSCWFFDIFTPPWPCLPLEYSLSTTDNFIMACIPIGSFPWTSILFHSSLPNVANPFIYH